MPDKLSNQRQAGAASADDLTVSRKALASALTNELREHFRWSSVEGLVELEAPLIAAAVLARIDHLGPSERRTEERPPTE